MPRSGRGAAGCSLVVCQAVPGASILLVMVIRPHLYMVGDKALCMLADQSCDDSSTGTTCLFIAVAGQPANSCLGGRQSCGAWQAGQWPLDSSRPEHRPQANFE
eukprot:GHUV01037745.1.p2 GENE.GHUV01037745.1~~GHUV01037745.1.p2  ORF type:complete len:104 (-),score=20.33 GHUV01037745.1:416-727(-)